MDITRRLSLSFEVLAPGEKLTLLDFCDVVGVQRDSTKLNRALNDKMRAKDPRALEVAKKAIELAGKQDTDLDPDEFKDALWDSVSRFLSYLASCAPGASQGREARTSKFASGSNGAHGGALNGQVSAQTGLHRAPLTSTKFIGISWPETDVLHSNCNNAHRELFGPIRSSNQTKRKYQEKIFFFYRLGFDQIEHQSPGDCSIRSLDKQLSLVIRRIPARICYQEPYDDWFHYEEEYFDQQINKKFGAQAVAYAFNGGLTLLSRDDELKENDAETALAKLSLAHIDFRPFSDPQEPKIKYYPGVISMESDVNPNRNDHFAPTCYKFILRPAPAGLSWDDVRGSSKDGGKSLSVPLQKWIKLNGSGYQFGDGSEWEKESDLEYTDRSPTSWRWYFNRLNVNRHVADMLIACPSTYSRWPKASVSQGAKKS